MTYRAHPSGITLTAADATIVKGMLARGDRQHDIAAWYGVNGGRIGEISTGQTFARVEIASTDKLPPPGPYVTGRDAAITIQALETARMAIDQAEALLKRNV
ncbi:MAG: hypothetical protein V3V13_03925 [Paracoccaceae bacterium]